MLEVRRKPVSVMCGISHNSQITLTGAHLPFSALRSREAPQERCARSSDARPELLVVLGCVLMATGTIYIFIYRNVGVNPFVETFWIRPTSSIPDLRPRRDNLSSVCSCRHERALGTINRYPRSRSFAISRPTSRSSFCLKRVTTFWTARLVMCVSSSISLSVTSSPRRLKSI